MGVNNFNLNFKLYRCPPSRRFGRRGPAILEPLITHKKLIANNKKAF